MSRIVLSRVFTGLLGLGVAAWGWSLGTVQGDEASPTPRALEAKDLATYLQDTCVACHQGEEAEGGLDLATFDPGAVDLDTTAVLLRMRDRVAAGEMPPEQQLDAAGRAALETQVQRFDQVLLHAANHVPPDPGRVTVRRLSRYEYTTTVRDLLGIDFVPGATFPNDDLGYGFDNIGDVLTISPLLLEKYALAAERIAEATLSLEDPDNPVVRRHEAESLESTMNGDGGRRGDRYDLFAPGAVVVRAKLPRKGRYRLRVSTTAQQAGPDLAQVTMRVEGRMVHRADVEAEVGTWEEIEHEVVLGGGAQRVSFGFENDYYAPNDPDPSQRDRNLSIDWVEIVGPLDPAPVTPGQEWLYGLDKGKGKPARRARKIVEALATRAWRRPVRGEEAARLAKLVEQAVEGGASFQRGLQLALQAVLVSPHFLYRIEPGGTSGRSGVPVRVGDDALATRLAYFLWSSLPDERLIKAARGRKLRTPEALAAEARRMLADPRASALATNFAVQWLELRNLEAVTPDPDRYGAFPPELAAAMRREAEMFFEAVMRERRDVRELLDADYVFVNDVLAKHYGIPGVRGSSFQRVAAPKGRRGGLLALGGVLTVTSNPTRTSPVKRGKWVLENILDAAPPPPPPGADSLDEAAVVSSASTLRETMQAHRENAVCASCHVRMDGLGLALENFDAVGRWRDRDDGGVIDASAVLPDGQRVDGAVALKALLRTDESFVRCLAKKLFTFALGRAPTDADELALFQLVASLPGDGPTIEDLVVGIVQMDAFRLRRARE